MVCVPVRSIILSLKLGDYLSIQAHKPCSISHLFYACYFSYFISQSELAYPYTAGARCGRCLNNCNNGLCGKKKYISFFFFCNSFHFGLLYLILCSILEICSNLK